MQRLNEKDGNRNTQPNSSRQIAHDFFWIWMVEITGECAHVPGDGEGGCVGTGLSSLSALVMLTFHGLLHHQLCAVCLGTFPNL